MFLRHQKIVTCFIFQFLAFLTIALSTAHAAIAPIESLNLNQALTRARTGSRQLKINELVLESEELNFDDAWDRMYIPRISLNASVESVKQIGVMPGSSAETLGATGINYGYPYSRLSIDIGQYTLFNFWRDQLAYEKSRLGFDRAKERYAELDRNTRFNIIRTYFLLWTTQEKLDAAKRSYMVASAILDLVNSQVRLGKAGQNEISSASVDKLFAATQVNEIQSFVVQTQRQLALLLGDPVDTQYKLSSAIKYAQIQLSEKQIVDTIERTSPQVRDAKLLTRTSQIDLEIAEKTRLPIPTISLSGISIGMTNQLYGSKSYTTSTATYNPGAIDIAAAVTLSLPLYGEGGFMNKRGISRARIARDVAETTYIQTFSQLKADALSTLFQIKQLEESIKNQKETAETNEKVLNQFFSNASKAKVSRLELRDALNQARAAQLQVLDSILNHLNQKLTLADTVGDENIVGPLE